MHSGCVEVFSQLVTDSGVGQTGCVSETFDVDVAGHIVALTNPDKILYPREGLRKRDVLDYYLEVAPVLLKHIAGRPLTRKRWVHGVGTEHEPGEAFFVKNLEESAPEWMKRVAFHHEDHWVNYPVATTAADLAWFVHMAAMELHVPQWRFAPDGSPAHPDRIVFDLDPVEGSGLQYCAELALLLRDLASREGLELLPVTSGSHGIHLYARLDGRRSSEDISEFAHELARAIESDHPQLATTAQRKAKRRGKVYVDWSQNFAGKTTVSPYSLRGRIPVGVAAPRTWDEIADPQLGQLGPSEVLQRLRSSGDLLSSLA